MSRYRSVFFNMTADVATGGTFVVGYPKGKTAGNFKNAPDHYFNALGGTYRNPEDFTVSFGATGATVTYNGATTIPAGTPTYFQFDEFKSTPDSGDFGVSGKNPTPQAVHRTTVTENVTVDLGSPAAASSTLLAASQAVALGVAAVLAATALDVPRNVVAAWTGTAIITITGTDEYGFPVIEQSASGTSHTGKKAFSTITSIVPSANVTGFTAGSGVVLGLPFWLAVTGMILLELQDNTVPTAGTKVAGLAQNTKSTATSADVRGTYNPNTAPDGTTSYRLLILTPEASSLGNDQYAG